MDVADDVAHQQQRAASHVAADQHARRHHQRIIELQLSGRRGRRGRRPPLRRLGGRLQRGDPGQRIDEAGRRRVRRTQAPFGERRLGHRRVAVATATQADHQRAPPACCQHRRRRGCGFRCQVEIQPGHGGASSDSRAEAGSAPAAGASTAATVPATVWRDGVVRPATASSGVRSPTDATPTAGAQAMTPIPTASPVALPASPATNVERQQGVRGRCDRWPCPVKRNDRAATGGWKTAIRRAMDMTKTIEREVRSTAMVRSRPQFARVRSPPKPGIWRREGPIRSGAARGMPIREIQLSRNLADEQDRARGVSEM